MPPLLILNDIHLSLGGPPLLDGAELTVEAQDRLCLVGRNGSGKSTLLKITAGLLQPDGGERTVQQGVSVRYLAQEPDLSAFPTTLAFVESAFQEHEDPHRGRYLLNQLGLSGDEIPSTLSGGEIRRAALAQLLAPSPDILLLDEPTNHLDLPAIEWLEKELGKLRSALVLVSHDRRFLESLSRTTVWLDRGMTRRLDKGFAEFEGWRDEVLEQEEVERHKLARKIVAEEHWVRYGVTARRKRNQRRMRELGDMRRELRESRRTQGTVAAIAAKAEASPKLIIEAKGIAKSYGERPIIRELSLRVLRGDRIGIVGPNGSGKTTLLHLLTGVLTPDAGTLKLGVSLNIITLDQRRESLDPTKSVKETLTEGQSDMVKVGDQSRHVVGYMKDFLFTPAQAGTPVSALSGGERGRLMLAQALARPSNLLVLDEPTNDLDLETLDLLQEMLADYEGTVLLVSHDRDFLDRVVTATIAYEGKGRWSLYAGGYSDMVAQRGGGVSALADKAVSPKSTPKAPVAATTDSRAKPRLSFKDKHALSALPARMEQLRAEIGRHHGALGDSELYARDPERFAATSAALAKAESELARAEDEWLRLEMLREEIEAG